MIWGGFDNEAELWQINESLARGELPPAKRANLVSKRKVVHERLYPQTKLGGPPGRA